MDNYRISIVGGMVFGILPNLPMENIMVTMFMATFGTIISFVVSVLLKWISKRLEKL
ncbi:hypothetical protein [Aequorivita marisscotiae]|uniref:Uncharacterized protein n=1 Tax=Aequorivita marisscotiae TaxID=3040348 RepID=A0ABY8KSR2_9FLAO|nr:hypothetical protein [Aequorivita sp. Ant34-E75]WGF92201.1 hypothetical protein QCQ61_13450 [Aequorivita sp. Ant34-E75]